MYGGSTKDKDLRHLFLLALCNFSQLYAYPSPLLYFFSISLLFISPHQLYFFAVDTYFFAPSLHFFCRAGAFFCCPLAFSNDYIYIYVIRLINIFLEGTMSKKHHLKEKLQEQTPEAFQKPDTNATPADTNADEHEKGHETSNETAAQIETLTAERDSWKDKALHLAADMENLRKRVAIDLEKNTKYANAEFAKSLLVVADGLDKAVEHAKKQLEEGKSADSFVQNLLTGIEMVQKQLSDALKKHHIEKMEILGTVFDPNFHQVISQIDDSSKPAGTIVDVMQTGYMIGDRVLREAMVIVTK